jgi:hypothetical protein
MLILRCSGLPLAFRCAGAVRPGKIRINEISDAADLGTAAHDGARALVETGRVDWDALPELARRHDVDEPELRLLLGLATKLWAEVEQSFPDALTEVELRLETKDLLLTGHADIKAQSANTAHIGDWKFGRKDGNHREQLLGYAALALLEDDSLEAATAGVLWVRDLEYEHYTLRRSELGQWLGRLVETIVRWDETFRPGPHCEHCPRSHECPARHALIRRDVAAIGDLDLGALDEEGEALAALTPEALVELVVKADLVKRVAERLRAAASRYVQNHGDVEGDELCLTLQHDERRHLKVVDAFPVLEAAGFADPEFGVVLDCSLPKVERIVATRAGKGKGAGAVRALRQKLEDAHAIELETVTKLVTRRK